MQEYSLCADEWTAAGEDNLPHIPYVGGSLTLSMYTLASSCQPRPRISLSLFFAVFLSCCSIQPCNYYEFESESIYNIIN